MKSLNKLMRGNKGATAVEYGIIAALIAGVVITAVTNLGGKLKNEVADVDAAITTP